MRQSKGRIRARIKGDLPITFSKERISSHGGLELFLRYFRAIDLSGRLRAAFGGEAGSDYGAVRLVLCLIGLLLAGGRRIAQLRLLGRDPIFLRFCGLKQLPRDRTVSRWLKRLDSALVERLATLVRNLVYEAIASLGLKRLTIDIDGTVLRTGAHVDGAKRGFNPHHPKDPSYYPLIAHLAQTGQILRVWNRPGNVHDSHGSREFLRVVLRDLRERFGRRLRLEVRLDGAFCQPWMIEFLDGEGVEYTIRLPIWDWLDLRGRISSQRCWSWVTPTVSGFELELDFGKWGFRKRVVVYRKRVSHRSRKNFQLDLFSPDDGHYEYSAIVTNKLLGIMRLWHFVGGRGGHEKTISELKQQVAFDVIPTNDRVANAIWQQISVLTHNLVRSFQLATGVRRRPSTWKRTYVRVFQSLQTLRFELIDQPVRMVRPEGRTELRFAVSEPTLRQIQEIEHRLTRAA